MCLMAPGVVYFPMRRFVVLCAARSSDRKERAPAGVSPSKDRLTEEHESRLHVTAAYTHTTGVLRHALLGPHCLPTEHGGEGVRRQSKHTRHQTRHLTMSHHIAGVNIEWGRSLSSLVLPRRPRKSGYAAAYVVMDSDCDCALYVFVSLEPVVALVGVRPRKTVKQKSH